MLLWPAIPLPSWSSECGRLPYIVLSDLLVLHLQMWFSFPMFFTAQHCALSICVVFFFPGVVLHLRLAIPRHSKTTHTIWQGTLTQLDEITNRTHDQEAHSDCLADFYELAAVG